MLQRFVTTQWIPYTVDLAFAFFVNPHNLPLLMPESMKTRIDRLELKPPPNPPIAGRQFARQEIVAGIGTEIDISFRPVRYLPMRVSWRTKITEFVWFSHFCDEQVKGPFERFRHRHGIRSEIQDGKVGTLLTEEVEFSLPLGTVGHVGDRVVLQQMKRMFRVRQERLPAILDAKIRQTS